MSHRNKLSNEDPNHLYEIRDKLDNDVFKYGISSDPIDEDGLSKRVRIQLAILNLAVKWTRFFATILLKEIPGRRAAKEIEQEYIDEYREIHGKPPRGNVDN